MNRATPHALLAAVIWISFGSARADPQLLPAYPNAAKLGSDLGLMLNDIPSDAVLMSTGDDIAKIFSFYRQKLTEMKRGVVENKFTEDSGTIGTYDEQSGEMHLATVIPLTSDQQLIILSAFNPSPLLENDGRIPSGLPAPAEARRVFSTQSGRGRELSRTIRFELPGQDLSTARQTLKKSALATGWQVMTGLAPFGFESLAFRKTNRMCIIQFEDNQMEAEDEPNSSKPGSAPSTTGTVLTLLEFAAEDRGEQP